MISDPNKRTLPIAISLFQGQHLTDWGLVFAASAIAIVPVILVSQFSKDSSLAAYRAEH
jgi:ABC-type glycerol-3-phosphate transport system permease component